MSLEKCNFERRIAVPVIPRATSARQRELEQIIAIEVIRALSNPNLTPFQAVVIGIQTACAENSVLLTEEPRAAA